MKIDVIYDGAGYWAALYIDGKIEFQGHSIRDDDWKKVLKKLGVEVNDYQEADFSDTGNAPDNLSEVRITYG